MDQPKLAKSCKQLGQIAAASRSLHGEELQRLLAIRRVFGQRDTRLRKLRQQQFPGIRHGMATLIAGAGWDPYMNGAWTVSVWLHLGLAYPWGWTPYHYGSLGISPSGWPWIPGQWAGFGRTRF